MQTSVKTEPQLIAVTDRDKEAIYRYNDGVFRSDIVLFDGVKYYFHKGIKYKLPAEFQGKKVICKV